MPVLNSFFRADAVTLENGRLWPDIAPIEVEGAVIVGQASSPPQPIWHCVTQSEAEQKKIGTLSGYVANGYGEVKASPVANDVFEAVWEEGTGPSKIIRRGKMKDKPGSGVIAEDLPPQFYAGVPAP